MFEITEREEKLVLEYRYQKRTNFNKKLICWVVVILPCILAWLITKNNYVGVVIGVLMTLYIFWGARESRKQEKAVKEYHDGFMDVLRPVEE